MSSVTVSVGATPGMAWTDDDKATLRALYHEHAGHAGSVSDLYRMIMEDERGAAMRARHPMLPVSNAAAGKKLGTWKRTILQKHFPNDVFAEFARRARGEGGGGRPARYRDEKQSEQDSASDASGWAPQPDESEEIEERVSNMPGWGEDWTDDGENDNYVTPAIPPHVPYQPLNLPLDELPNGFEYEAAPRTSRGMFDNFW